MTFECRKGHTFLSYSTIIYMYIEAALQET